jgi:hypothetical protein
MRLARYYKETNNNTSFQRGTQIIRPPEAPQALAAGCEPIRPLLFVARIFG